MSLLSTLLTGFTILVGFLGLGMTVWLGLYLVALTPSRVSSWVAALLIWGVSLVFALHLLQLGQPLFLGRPWLPYEVLRWVAIPLPLAWFWLLYDLLPRPLRSRTRHFPRIAVGITLLLCVATALLGPGFGFGGIAEGRWRWLFYPLYLLSILITVGPTISLSLRAARLGHVPVYGTARRALAAAAIVAVGAAFYGIGGFWLWPDIPTLPAVLALLAAAVMLGTGIVLYRIGAGETNAAAFVYSLTNAAAITLLYTLVVGGMVALLDFSWLVLVPVVPLAVSAHWVTDWMRGLFDLLFYRAPIQRVRAELRTLIQTLDRDAPLEPRLQPVLAHLASRVHAPVVALALIDAAANRLAMRLVATHPPTEDAREVAAPPLPLDSPAPLGVPPPVDCPTGGAWAVPLVGPGGPLAMLIAWSRPMQPLSDVDLALLGEVGSQLEILLVEWEAQGQRLAQIEQLVATYRAQAASLETQLRVLAGAREGQPTLAEVTGNAREWVEQVCRHLHNVAYLGQHPLAQLQVIEERAARQNGASLTHLERGRAVRELCEDLIERLRPPGSEPGEPYPAEWRLYTVLHAAYVEGEPNREIMNRLYIGEGTFHRARREALDSLAEVLVELERRARAEP